MSQEIISGSESRAKLLAGVDKLANAVKSTLGPRGENVLIQREFDGPRVTKDGVTVARAIHLSDPVEDMGAQLVVNVARSTNDLAGDGTTTATVLAQAIYKESQKMLAAGYNSNLMRKGMDKALKRIVDYLKLNSESVSNNLDKIERVATVSANNDAEIGKIIREAVSMVGNDGIITLDESKTTETYVKTSKGFQFDRGYLSPYFVTDQESMKVEYQDAFVVVTDKKISSIAGPQDKVVAMLECMANSGKPFLIIAEDVDGMALQALVLNRVKGNLKLVAVRAPKLGELRKNYLEEIALITGATLISDTTGVDFDVFKGNNTSAAGTVKQLIVTKETTTLVGGGGNQENIDKFISTLTSRIDNSTDKKERDQLKERKGRVSGQVATICIGAESDVALKELHDLIEDSLNATKAAIEEGIIPGGGSALVHASAALTNETGDLRNQDEAIGYKIVMDAILSPFYNIMNNAGLSAEVILNKVMREDYRTGFNVITESYEDMFISGIVDPVKVTRLALTNAVSVVSTLITTSVTIFEKPNEKNKD